MHTSDFRLHFPTGHEDTLFLVTEQSGWRQDLCALHGTHRIKAAIGSWPTNLKIAATCLPPQSYTCTSLPSKQDCWCLHRSQRLTTLHEHTLFLLIGHGLVALRSQSHSQNCISSFVEWLPTLPNPLCHLLCTRMALKNIHRRFTHVRSALLWASICMTRASFMYAQVSTLMAAFAPLQQGQSKPPAGLLPVDCIT